MLTLTTAGHHEARIDSDTWPILLVDKVNEETTSVRRRRRLSHIISKGEAFMDPSLISAQRPCPCRRLPDVLNQSPGRKSHIDSR